MKKRILMEDSVTFTECNNKSYDEKETINICLPSNKTLGEVLISSLAGPDILFSNFDQGYNDPAVRCRRYEEYVIWWERPSSGILNGNVYAFPVNIYKNIFGIPKENINNHISTRDYNEIIDGYLFSFPNKKEVVYENPNYGITSHGISIAEYMNRAAKYWNHESPPRFVNVSSETEIKNQELVCVYSGWPLTETQLEYCHTQDLMAFRCLSSPFFPFWTEIPMPIASDIARVLKSGEQPHEP